MTRAQGERMDESWNQYCLPGGGEMLNSSRGLRSFHAPRKYVAQVPTKSCVDTGSSVGREQSRTVAKKDNRRSKASARVSRRGTLPRKKVFVVMTTTARIPCSPKPLRREIPSCTVIQCQQTNNSLVILLTPAIATPSITVGSENMPEGRAYRSRRDAADPC